MILLSVANLRKYFGQEPVLDGVTFDIRPGERVGLVGPNGAGKTTLFKILVGQEQADAGTVEKHGSVRIGYLEQHPQFPAGRTLWEEASSALDHLRSIVAESERVANQLAATDDEAEHRKLGARFDVLQHELRLHDAFQLDHKIERVLHGLGFVPSAYQQEVVTLSGGQQNRLLLAKLLLAEPELMLLDEPSNHLDIEATEWLENYLVDAPSAILVVSHDRYFLDKVTTRTLELYQGTVDSFTGNFSAYWTQKAERLEVQRRSFEKQQTEIAKLEDFVRKNSYGMKHAQAEDRRKKLERIERVDRPRDIAAPPMAFPAASRTGDLVVRVEHLSKGFDRPLFKDLTFDILRGEKWGILGPNGSGKTTLLRCLLDLLPLDAGRVQLGAGVRVGYFDQMLSCLDQDDMVVDAIRPSHKEFNEPERRSQLARFGLTGDIVFQRVRSLSGGEKNRAALAWLAASDANFLILDEPTNHLDLWARASLERALKAFDGSVLFVSHDRYFLNQVADHLLVVEPGRFRAFAGNYETYLHLVRQAGGVFNAALPGKGKEQGAGSKEQGGKDATSADDRGGAKPAKRKRKFPYRKADEIEREIKEREAEIESLHALLASPGVHRDGDRMRELVAQLETDQASLEQLYEHWEEAVELN